MAEFLIFAFSGFWTWVGLVILVWIVALGIGIGLSAAIRDDKK